MRPGHMFLNHPIPESPKQGFCAICKKHVAPHPEDAPRSCLSWTCQQEFRRRKQRFGQAQCQFCLASLNVHQAHTRTCDDERCQQQKLHKQIQDHKQKLQRELEEKIEEFRKKLAVLHGPTAPELLLIPAMDRPLVPLQQERKDRLEAHLRGLLAALEQEQPDEAPQPDAPGQPEVLEAEAAPEPSAATKEESKLATFVANSCRTCRGFCCTHGADSGYLVEKTLQRVQKQHPDLEPEELLDGYMASLADEVVQGSCIFHGATGCGLPFEWRSDTCNSYYCATLHRLLAFPQEVPNEMVLVASYERDISRVARCTDEGEYQLLTLDATPPETE